MGPKRTYRCCGYQQITSLSSSTGLTIPLRGPDGSTCKPNAVLLQPQTQTVRFRDDGTAPSASVGMLLPTGTVPFYYDGDLNAIRFIETAASAALNVLYYEDTSVT